MKNILGFIQNRLQNVVNSKTASIISGIVCAIPFVFEGAFLLSFIMYIPLFCLFYSNKEKGVNSVAFLYGFFFFMVGYSFLCELYPLDFAGFSPIEAVGVIGLALTAVPLIHGTLFVISFAVCRKITKGFSDVTKILVFPLIVVFSEYLQTLGPLAFPWCRVSIAQSEFLPFLQSASLFGSYFITYIVLLINGLIAYAFLKPEKGKIPLVIAVTVFVVNTAFGVIRLALPDSSEGESFTAISLQGNISSSSKWSGSVYDMLDIYMDLAENSLDEAKNSGFSENTLMLMPETALPVTITGKSSIGSKIADFADKNDVCFVAGAFSEQDGLSGNSLFMFDKNGGMSDAYSKRVLVPFGEFVPYRCFLTAIVPALDDINMLSSDLYEGNDTYIFETEAGKAGGIICYESVFPKLCRESVNDGAEILLVSTNDSWFGTSSALNHHLSASVIRAIENGVPVIRAANTGISALINRKGICVKTLEADRRGYVCAELTKGVRTLYSYTGDVFLILCLALILGCIIKQIKLNINNKTGKMS